MTQDSENWQELQAHILASLDHPNITRLLDAGLRNPDRYHEAQLHAQFADKLLWTKYRFSQRQANGN